MTKLVPDYLWNDAGHGVQWVFFHSDIDNPAGILERHQCPGLDAQEAKEGGQVLFDTPYARGHFPDAPKWRVVSIEPLTLRESIICKKCGWTGFIVDGKWIPKD